MRIILLLIFISISYAAYPTIETEQQLNEYIRSSSSNVIVFVDPRVCSNDKDDRCVEQRTQLEQIESFCTGENIQFSISTNTQIAEKQFNIYNTLPKLCFFRDGYPVIYSESLSNMDNLQEWFGEVRERVTRTLDDKSFEHDTQASTGSTTGDWFILFKKSNESRSLIPTWEATSVHFRNRAIFAYVNIDENPLIQKRFHIYNLPTFILFKRGKMYRYESASWKQSAFTDFLENDYQKFKGEIVPIEPKVFSFAFDSAVKIIPMYLIIIPMICLAIVLIFLVLASGWTKKRRTTTTTAERPSFQVKID